MATTTTKENLTRIFAGSFSDREVKFESPEGSGKYKKEMRRVFQGVMKAEDFLNGELDEYQRQPQPDSYILPMIPNIASGTISAATVAFRDAKKYKKFETTNDGITIDVPGDFFVVDGQQRQIAIRKMVAMLQKWQQDVKEGVEGTPKNPPFGPPQIRVAVFFGTTKKEEKDIFHFLNVPHRKVNAGQNFYNMCDRSPALEAIYQLTGAGAGELDDDFVLKGKVAWNRKIPQSMSIGSFLSLVLQLHAEKGGRAAQKTEDKVEALNQLADVIGVDQLIANIRVFFKALDNAFDLTKVLGTKKRAASKIGFHMIVANVFAHCQEFWKASGSGGPQHVFHVPPRYAVNLANVVNPASVMTQDNLHDACLSIVNSLNNNVAARYMIDNTVFGKSSKNRSGRISDEDGGGESSSPVAPPKSVPA